MWAENEAILPDSSIDQISSPGSIAKEYFEITQELHADLELYTNELISLNNGYLYREDKLMIDDLIAQILPVFKGCISESKHVVRTVNRLFYLEFFHLEWEQGNPKAVAVIDEYVAMSKASIEKNIEELQTVPLKVPSMTDVPLLLEHYEKTREMLHMTLATLNRIQTLTPEKKEVVDV